MYTSNPKPLGESLGIELVTVYVGKKRKEFVVHKNLICDKVDYFQKAFKGNFVESNGNMHLSDETAGSFALFVDWLYKDIIPVGNTIQHFINLTNLHIFSDKICHSELGNRVMDSIRTLGYENPKLHVTPALTCYVYSNTSKISPLRNWYVQMLAFSVWGGKNDVVMPSKKHLKELAIHFRDHVDLFVDFFHHVGMYPKLLPWPVSVPLPSNEAPKCEFHKHDKGQVCVHKKGGQVHHIEWVGDYDLSDESKFHG